MTPAEQGQIFDFGAVCYSDAISLIINAIALGPAIVGLTIVIQLLQIKTWREPKAIQLLCCMIIVLAVAVSIIMQGIIVFTQIKLSIQKEITNPPSSLIISGDIEEFLDKIITLVSDFVICWRAWVLLPQDKLLRFALAIIMMCNIGVTIADFSVDVDSGSSAVLDWLAITLSLLVNMTATVWKARRACYLGS
ncbi:hypothetical protein BDP27DRAFT_1424108 [Rhodocollybia butyracea]|uniref:Uncharacterized protein n=1 Tax=Rhodocollybia butyracea TaxID=206335 RepID=A0A9P5PQE1_9AGAR|nr:hypothetical protein BDP27DRAFT_1424108 [Rhodocollybia butyracea]